MKNPHPRSNPPTADVGTAGSGSTAPPPRRAHHFRSDLPVALRRTVVLGLLWWPACAIPLPPPVPAQAPFTAADFRDRAPVEVALLPPSIAPDFGTAAADQLRMQVYRRLIEKGYTPLDPDFVDRSVAQEMPRGRRSAEVAPPRIVALRGDLPADAYLFLNILSVLILPGADPAIYRIEARATLLEGKTGVTLYENRTPMTFQIDYGGDQRLTARQLDNLLRQYSGRLLGSLPSRRSS